jgi:acetyl esterase/lipase
MIDKKRLDPGLRFLADADNGMELGGETPIEEIRRSMPIAPVQGAHKIKIWDEYTDSNGYSLRIRLYEPKDRPEVEIGAFYWMHGGGMALGTPEVDDALLAKVAITLGIIVASVDYRLTPEHPYPIPLEDSYAGLVWLASHADELGIDKSRIAIGGASAGGNLCAALALLSRDRKGPEVFFQVPLFPMLDDRMDTASAKEFTAEVIPFSWNTDGSKVAWEWYLRDSDRSNVPIYAAPARARDEDLAGLPPAYSCVGEFDPLRDETVEYIMRLLRAGVSAELHVYPGAFHGFEMELNGSEIGRRAVAEYIAALGRAFER